MKVDKTNRAILEILQHDALATYDAIAKRLGRSPSLVRDRIRAMESDGVIQGYCAIVDRRRLGQTTEALIFCNLPAGNEEEAAATCIGLSQVTRVFHVSGEKRTVLRVATHDNRSLWEFITTDLKAIGIVDLDVKVILKTRQRFPPDLVFTDTVD
jgi:DNA-binding Lrp family transcriptional regulator